MERMTRERKRDLALIATLLVKLIFLVLLTAPSATDAQAIAAKVIGGTPTKDGRYSYAQISLQKPRYQGDRQAHQCGGSLVARDIILTAAHCIGWFTEAHIDRHNFNARSDEYDIISVERTEAHELFEKEGSLSSPSTWTWVVPRGKNGSSL